MPDATWPQVFARFERIKTDGLLLRIARRFKPPEVNPLIAIVVTLGLIMTALYWFLFGSGPWLLILLLSAFCAWIFTIVLSLVFLFWKLSMYRPVFLLGVIGMIIVMFVIGGGIVNPMTTDLFQAHGFSDEGAVMATRIVTLITQVVMPIIFVTYLETRKR